MRIANIIIALAICAFFSNAKAEGIPKPTVIGAHLYSYHFDNKAYDTVIVDGNTTTTAHNSGYNNRNPGLYARWSNGVTVGTYYNSNKNQSYYVGKTFTDDADRFSVTLGLVSGYTKVEIGKDPTGREQCSAPGNCIMVEGRKVILPMLVPSVRIGITDHLSARLALMATQTLKPITHLSLEWRL